MSLAVHLRNAVCLLGRFPALAGVDLDVACGEAVLLSGPNGAGKSTVLRALAGLVPVVEGTAIVLGHDLTADRRAVRRSVGLVGHAGALYDDLTVAENVRFAVRAAAAGTAGIPDALVRLGLDGRLADVQVARLSAGQRRRCALAVLLARDPELWLLDEPHAGLDGAGRDLLDVLALEAVGRGRTVILASHDLDRARLVASRSIIVAGGVSHRPQGTGRADGRSAIEAAGNGDVAQRRGAPVVA